MILKPRTTPTRFFIPNLYPLSNQTKPTLKDSSQIWTPELPPFGKICGKLKTQSFGSLLVKSKGGEMLCRRSFLSSLKHHRATGSLYHHCRVLHNGPDTLEELLDRHIIEKKDKSRDNDENEIVARQRLSSTRREALSLYRDIIRATRFFMWPDARGVLWRDILRENARKEFEDAKFEKDPEIITKLLIGGREAVESAIDKLVEKQKQQIEKENSNRDRH
ncbi:uncharacterized protein LOC108206532 isoform X2 [Daucus carota subsp. sativus]|uniref:uncharacterized protein LOC108206532 isoform X2 n=1 Tax=Daucus carota subsp. sativus TaxID=79200 RepID=UPI0007EEFB86|nr:PREDICTED: uncharacterized protein LOC108206532 isoform X2 [Daucus carota subsp. sativus]